MIENSEYNNSANTGIWVLIKRFATLVGIFAPIGILIVALSTRKTKNFNIDVRVVSNQFLTPDTKVNELKGVYYYNDSIIDNLWQVDIELINTGNVTVIGKDLSKNIIGDKLLFEIKGSGRLLNNVKKIHDGFYHKLEVTDTSSFFLSFNQWRPSEKIQYRFYYETNSPNYDLIISPKVRYLIDGNINFFDIAESNVLNKERIADTYPKPLNFWGRVLGFIFILFIGVFSLSILSLYIRDSFYYFQWKLKYYNKFLKYFNENEEELKIRKLFSGEFDKLKSEPQKIYDTTFWNESKIPTPRAYHMRMTSYKELFYMLTISLIVLFSCFSIITNLIVI